MTDLEMRALLEDARVRLVECGHKAAVVEWTGDGRCLVDGTDMTAAETYEGPVIGLFVYQGVEP